MADFYSQAFIQALKERDRKALQKIPKADLHNHCVLSGSRDFLEKRTGRRIEPMKAVLQSMQEMDAWSGKNIGSYFDGTEGRKLLIEAAFVQAASDGVSILEVGEDVWGLGEFFHHDIGELIDCFQQIRERTAPDMKLRLQIGLSRHCSIPYLTECLKPFWGRKEFYSIDLYGDEMAQPIENFLPIYEKARENGLKLKAHVGEWGSAGDVVEAVKILGLDEVQHGIAAADSDEAVAFLKENHVRLNITPTSNLMLGRVKDAAQHPIRKLYRAGVDVTVNSDDVLVFDSDVSGEYLLLYQSGCLEAEELDAIRINGLKDPV